MGGAISSPVTYFANFNRIRIPNGHLKALPGIPQTTEMADEDSGEETGERRDKLKQEMDEFKNNLDKKREERKVALARIVDELNKLRGYKDDLEREQTIREGMEKQVSALKEVAAVSNEMLQLRESQIGDLKKRLHEMENSTEESLKELRSRYEQQMDNINKLRRLYEERADAVARGHSSEMEREKAKYTLLELKMAEVINQSPEIEALTAKNTQLEEAIKSKEEELEMQKELQYSSNMECKNLTSQLTLINNLFSNLLTGNDLDFDLLTKLLQDNHNLITDLIANGDINETAALLFDIAEKVYKKSESADGDGVVDNASQATLSAKEEIASNLPKVWRVLIELLSRHEDSNNVVQGGSEECYKSVQTPHGSRTVISVSQTFLRLKDLILEKNSLVKEVGRLKTLNGHLETRLDLQERRLSTVCTELRKTWGVVNKLKVQHRQLHTHEKILRYELHHKRQMLTELKHELKYCRDTWDRVREKNTQSEHEWEILRREFALRKNRDASGSGESGYEDDEASQSPDISTSDSSDYDVSDSRKSIESPSLEFEDAASDATVIELIDMLDFDSEQTETDFQQIDHHENVPVEIPLVDDDDDDDNDDNNRQEIVRPDEDVSEESNLESAQRVEQPEVKLQDIAPITIDQQETSFQETDTDSNDTFRNEVQIESPENCSPISSEEVGKSDASTSSTSSSTNPENCQRSSEDILNARAERLKRLETQCQSLLTQMTLTSFRSDTLSIRLEQLHEQYGPNRTSKTENYKERSENLTEEVDNTENSDNRVIEEISTSTVVDERLANQENEEENDSDIRTKEQEDRLKERMNRVSRIEEEYLHKFHQPAICANVISAEEDIQSSSNCPSSSSNCPSSSSNCPSSSSDCPSSSSNCPSSSSNFPSSSSDCPSSSSDFPSSSSNCPSSSSDFQSSSNTCPLSSSNCPSSSSNKLTEEVSTESTPETNEPINSDTK